MSLLQLPSDIYCLVWSPHRFPSFSGQLFYKLTLTFHWANFIQNWLTRFDLISNVSFLSARLSAELWETEETLSTVRRSGPPSPLYQTIPRPPSTSPSKASPLSKRLSRSFVHRVQGQQAGALDSPPPVVNKLSSSGQISSHPSTARTKVETLKHSSSSAETSGSPSRSSRFQTNTAGGAAAHMSSNCRPLKKCDLFPQGKEDDNSRLVSRSRSISGLSHSSNNHARSLSATRKSKTHSTTVPVGTV